MPSLLGYVDKFHELPKNLTFSIAALLAFYKGEEIVDSALIGHRGEETYKIMDDPDVLEFFRDNSNLASYDLAKKYLSNTKFHGQDLTQVEGLLDAVAKDLENIRTYGARKAMEML